MEQNKLVRILSGINSINFDEGFDKKIKVFDKRKTNMLERDMIYCFTDGDGTRPVLGEKITEALLDYTKPVHFFKRGRKYIISGLVDKTELRPGNFSYVIGPVLTVDKVYETKGGVLRPKRLIDISDEVLK